MTKQEALKKIKELEKYVEDLDKKSVGFEDDNIFLLSIDEYNKYKEEIPHINTWWWLRSPGGNDSLINAVDVNSDSSVDKYGLNVDYKNEAVRPALKYSSIKSECVSSKERRCFVWNEIKWKIIDKENEIAISYMPINFDKFDYDSNDYENSYIRKWLLDWYKAGIKDD